MNRCHVCGNTAVNADAALCLTCSGRADRREIVYDPNTGWRINPALNAKCEALLARHLAVSITEANWADNRLYLVRHLDRLLESLEPLCVAPKAALPNGSNIEVSTVREGFR